MAKKQKPATIVMTDGKREIIRQLLSEYDIKTAEDIQEALTELLGGTIKEMMEAEMGYHLGYEKSARSNSDNARNGYKSKRVNSSYGNFSVEVPQDSLSRKLYRNAKRIFPRLTKKLSLCTRED
jgi:transposase-like protein